MPLYLAKRVQRSSNYLIMSKPFAPSTSALGCGLRPAHARHPRHNATGSRLWRKGAIPPPSALRPILGHPDAIGGPGPFSACVRFARKPARGAKGNDCCAAWWRMAALPGQKRQNAPELRHFRQRWNGSTFPTSNVFGALWRVCGPLGPFEPFSHWLASPPQYGGRWSFCFGVCKRAATSGAARAACIPDKYCNTCCHRAGVS